LAKALEELRVEGLLPESVEHRRIKYLYNRIESEHGKLKRLINPTRRCQSMKTAYATIKGFEVMRMFKKGRFDFWLKETGVKGEVMFINRLFDI
jgi:IS6 family transposase